MRGRIVALLAERFGAELRASRNSTGCVLLRMTLTNAATGSVPDHSVVLSVAAALVLAGSAGAQNPTLFATVGPGFSIRVVDGAGNRVTRVPPGTYTVGVKDLGDGAQLPPVRAGRIRHDDDRRGHGRRDVDGDLPGGHLPLPVRPALHPDEGRHHGRARRAASRGRSADYDDHEHPAAAPARNAVRLVRKLVGSVGPGATIGLAVKGGR